MPLCKNLLICRLTGAFTAHTNTPWPISPSPAQSNLAIRRWPGARNDAELRDRNIPTVPSTIGREIATNPFLRCAEPEVIAAAAARLGKQPAGPAETFGAIREWKNNF